jgi:hypothetical protein
VPFEAFFPRWAGSHLVLVPLLVLPVPLVLPTKGGGGGHGSAVNQSTDCALEQALVESRTTRQNGILLEWAQ